MKRAFVTGAAGFVGANLARRLLELGHETHLLVSPGTQMWRLDELRPHASFHAADLCDAKEVQRVLNAIRPDWVFHLAAHGAYSWQTDATAIFQTNVLGTVHLLESCQAVGVEAIVNTGSSSEYGCKDHAPAEDEWLEPNSSYAVSKAAATLLCRHLSLAKGLRLCTLRLYSVYGPFEDPARLMPTLLVHAAQGNYPPLVRPQVARDFIYIDDVLDAYLLAIADPRLPAGAVYNVGAGQQTSLGKLVSEVQRLFRLQQSPVWDSMSQRSWDTDTWVADSRRLQQELGWKPRVTLEQGLSQFRDWLSQSPWKAHYTAQIRPPQRRSA